MDKYDEQLRDMKDTKTWILDAERQDVRDTMTMIEEWLKDKQEEQSKLEMHEDPAFTSKDVVIKMHALKKLFNKVSNKKRPKPKKKETIDIETLEEEASEEKKEEPEKKEDEQEESTKQEENTEQQSEEQ